MLAKACSSVEELLKRMKSSVPKAAARLCAEFKQLNHMRKSSKAVRYDGQRAQIHILENGLEP